LIARAGPPAQFETDSPRGTEEVGAGLARQLRPGDAVRVSGELGAGKTTLIRGACRELGVTAPVTSPTFTIGSRYRGRVPVAHLDLFRLEDLGAEEPGLLDDYLTADAVAFVEWPEAGAAILDFDFTVEIEHAGGDRRRITIAPGRRQTTPARTREQHAKARAEGEGDPP
jgi:tRNA threonylcarbamoyladenosine biosynthesis protein TsaE